jgi:chromosome segregation ATPase
MGKNNKHPKSRQLGFYRINSANKNNKNQLTKSSSSKIQKLREKVLSKEEVGVALAHELVQAETIIQEKDQVIQEKDRKIQQMERQLESREEEAVTFAEVAGRFFMKTKKVEKEVEDVEMELAEKEYKAMKLEEDLGVQKNEVQRLQDLGRNTRLNLQLANRKVDVLQIENKMLRNKNNNNK